MGKKKEKESPSANAAAVGATLKDVTARHGAAINEHLAAYDGINYEAGFTPRARMQKSLQSISKYKVHPNFKDANLKQQAGFAAEVIETSRARAEACVKGKRPSVLRMDDAGPKGARHSNDQLIDIVEVDASGNPIPGSGYQMKFVGKSGKDCAKKLLDSKFRKYPDKNVSIEVSSDLYAATKRALKHEAAETEKAIAAIRKLGKEEPQHKLEALERLQDKLDRCRKIEKNLKKSRVSSKDASWARKDGKGFTKSEVARQKNDAAIEGAKIAVAVAGVMSGIGNLMAIARGDKTCKEATIDVAKDTLIAGAGGYFTAKVGSEISGLMMRRSEPVIRNLGRSGLPGAAITYVASSVVVLGKYFRGEMRGQDCMDEMASLGMTMAVGSASASVVAAIPGVPAVAVGGIALLPMAGAILGSMVASAVFIGLKNWAYKDAYAAEAQAREVEARCAEACRMLNAYKQQIEDYFKSSNIEFFKFMNEALFMIDSDDFETSVAGANKISKACGGKVHITNIDDVDNLMSCSFKIGR